jgi:hypothetical protein
MRNNALDATIEDDIKNKKYDIIVYGTSWHENKAEAEMLKGAGLTPFKFGLPYYDLVKAAYKPEEVILICGFDIHDCEYKNQLPNGHHIFVRELV